MIIALKLVRAKIKIRAKITILATEMAKVVHVRTQAREYADTGLKDESDELKTGGIQGMPIL